MQFHFNQRRILCLVQLLVAGVAWFVSGEAFAQTNPVAQALPFSQAFGASGFTTLPAGVAAWNGLSGASINSAADAAASAPTGDATLTSATPPQTTGGVYGYATGGNGRLYIQTSSNGTNGADQLVIALNTTARNAITLDYDIEVISAQTRTIGVLCQYRVGTSGAWTTLTPASGLNPFSQAGGTTGVKTSPHITLPIAAENQPVVQIRWATWRGSETGASSGAAIDTISVNGSVASATLSAAVAPPSVLESAGANAATLTVTRTGDTSTALPVTLLIGDATEAAYDGPNPLEIPAGQSSVTFPIRAVDDDGNDGTQNVLLQVSAPAAISASTTLSVLDDEDLYSPPPAYYETAAGQIGAQLKATLKTIASPANYHAYAYADTYTPLRAIWEDPNNSANLITVYSGSSIGKSVVYYPGGPSPDVSWSREHVWPDSFGLDPDHVDPGSTGGDAGPDFTDLFNLRPCLQTVNSQRSNLYYDFTTGTPTIPPLAPQCSHDGDSWEPRDVEKGDLARTALYMATRYDGTDAGTLDLEIANTPNTALARFAKLAALLRWNDEHPPTTAERQRNHVIYTNYQHNRNPFIDHPEYINLIWGNVRIEKLTASVTEGGAGDAFTIVLGSQPTADVTITLSTTPVGQVAVAPPSVMFTSANWNQPQTVNLSAMNDTVHEATLITNVQSTITSNDARYAALVPLEVAVTVLDDDPAIAPATLPIIFGGPWDALPTGFLGPGLGSPYPSSLGGDAATGSAKLDSTGDQLTIAFNSPPAMMSYQLKGNPGSGTTTNGTFVIQQSVDGTTFTTLRTVTNKDNTDQTFSDSLALNTRYVRFAYTEKISGNIQLDKIAITAAPPYSVWAAAFGLNTAAADALNDNDNDGLANLVEYAVGASPTAADAGQHQPVLERFGGKLRLTAIVRTGDPALAFVVQTNTALIDSNGWTNTGVTQLTPVDQTDVPAGFTRVVFEVNDNGATQRFLRLRFVLMP